jgi:uncharacterized protein
MGRRIIDTCIHHRWGADAELLPYFDPAWQGWVGKPGTLPGGAGMRKLMPTYRYSNPAGDDLESARPESVEPARPAASSPRFAAASAARPPGSSYPLLAEQVLERDGVERALLLFDRAMFAPATPNPFYAAALVRAINDWNVGEWLARDERLYGAVLVPDQTPDEAAAEVRRIGVHPQIAAVLLAAPSTGKLFGHPLYNPIYEAAAELDLTVVIHRGGDALPDTPTGPAGGPPATFAEYASAAPFALQSHVVSLITNGVLAKFPALRICVMGAGITWMAGLLRRAEQIYRELRREVPWVREPPSEYFRRQIRVGTYGLERNAGRLLDRLIDTDPSLVDLLVYGSGYPSWDTGSVEEIESLFPSAWQSQILFDNAERWFAWTAASAAASRPLR